MIDQSWGALRAFLIVHCGKKNLGCHPRLGNWTFWVPTKIVLFLNRTLNKGVVLFREGGGAVVAIDLTSF